MPTIVIQGTVINFPDSGSSPNWAPAVIDFAEAVQNALAGVVGASDVPPQSYSISSFNPGSNINIPSLNFSTLTVRSAFIRYAISRSTTATTVDEGGTIVITYNPTGMVGSLWEASRQYNGDAQVTFYVTDTGQVQLNTAALAGLNHVGTISYSAQALLQSY